MKILRGTQERWEELVARVSNNTIKSLVRSLRLKIAYYVWEYYPRLVGGLGPYAMEITRRFIVNGHEVVIFTMNPGELATHDL